MSEIYTLESSYLPRLGCLSRWLNVHFRCQRYCYIIFYSRREKSVVRSLKYQRFQRRLEWRVFLALGID